MQSKAKTVAAYLKELPPDRKAAVGKLRSMIKQAAPAARESMKYGMPVYELDGGGLAVASQKQYIALYVTPVEVVAAFRTRLDKLSVGKCCIRFRRPEQIPWGVIGELVAAVVETCTKINDTLSLKRPHKNENSADKRHKTVR